MAQIIGWILCFYLVIKGLEVLQIGMASTSPDRVKLVFFGGAVAAACLLAAMIFGSLLNEQAATAPSLPSFPSTSTP